MVKKLQLVIVTFKDSTTFPGWENIDNADEERPMICCIAGWLLDENDEYIKVTLGIGDHNVMERIIIPMACVEEVYKVKEVEFEDNGRPEL